MILAGGGAKPGGLAHACLCFKWERLDLDETGHVGHGHVAWEFWSLVPSRDNHGRPESNGSRIFFS